MFRSRPIVRFLGGVGAMLLASVVGTVVLGFAITWIWPPDDPNPEFGLQRAPHALIAGSLLGMAGLAWFSVRRRDGMPLLGGLAVVALEAALIIGLLATVSIEAISARWKGATSPRG